MSTSVHTPKNPGGPPVTRVIRIGGAGKLELLSRLELAGVGLNEAAQALFADERFTTSVSGSLIEIVERSVGGLGLRSGATFDQIVEHAAVAGLSLCPMEAGPHFRLQYTDQPEGFLGHPPSRHRAPPGSITVASAPLADDEETPRGFYLRRIQGVLWLRGYRSWPGHIFSPDDTFVFLLRPHHAA